jgi:hypothetical protein
MTLAKLASAYQCSRQNLHAMSKRHGLSVQDLADPEVVFEKLLADGRSSTLRSKLSNPISRGLIREELDLAAIRGPVPSIEGKISSIN